MVSLAPRQDEITGRGARLVGISVDSPGQHAAMVRKLRLPFSLLSDPDGTGAIKPYDLWHAERAIARPAVVIVAPTGEEVFRRVSHDFADRLHEDDVIGALDDLDLPPTSQDLPDPGEPDPGPRAMPVEGLRFYFRGAKFAVTAMKMRHPEVSEDADAYVAQMERYMDNVATHLR